MPRNTIIMGAAGRDFHNFNCCFRDDPEARVIAFTAEQIPEIAGRRYPPSLAGPLYPEGIPIEPEARLGDLIRRERVEQVVFSYSDISYPDLMHRAALAQSCGADFVLLGAGRTMLRAAVPVVSVCAVRTGCGKSPCTRALALGLKSRGFNPVVVRHPMPYGDLEKQAVQRFASLADMDEARCSLEEREEYEPLVEAGLCVFAGVDYGRILEAAQQQGDLLIWDGGNNDLPFFRPEVHLVLFDPHRAGHETLYYPSEANMLLADIALITKTDSAPAGSVERLRQSITKAAPHAQILLSKLPIRLEAQTDLRGRRVLVVEDGPTLTHGGMPHGAGYLAAEAAGARILDPAPIARGSLRETLRKYPHIRGVLPAMGYSPRQLSDLEASIAAADCEFVILGTPADLARLLRLSVPAIRARYEFKDAGSPGLLEAVCERLGTAGGSP